MYKELITISSHVSIFWLVGNIDGVSEIASMIPCMTQLKIEKRKRINENWAYPIVKNGVMVDSLLPITSVIITKPDQQIIIILMLVLQRNKIKNSGWK